MASASYIRAKNKKAKERSLKAVEARRNKRLSEASDLKVVGTIKTTGTLGNHFIELIDGGEPNVVWMRINGEIRKPRSANGIKRVLSHWIWRQRTDNKA